MHRKSSTPASSAMRSALSILQGEHASYATVLKNLVGHLERARAHSYKPRLEIFAAGLGFIGTFIEQFHHPKEDEFLFLALRRHTNEADEVLRDLQFDHAHGTRAIDELKAALDRAQSGGIAELHLFAEAMDHFMHAQFAHMEREESIVIPLARSLLTEEDWKEIDRAFCANSDPMFSAKHSAQFGALFQPGAKDAG